MATTLNLKKGLDIRLQGGIADFTVTPVSASKCAITPDDYPGIVPKVDVKEGDVIKAGDPLFHDKQFPDIKIVSPVSGTVEAVVRGERRKLERIVINPSSGNAEEISVPVQKGGDRTISERILLDSGLWALMRQLPYNIVPRPGVAPRDIFITGFDSAPLAPEPDRWISGQEKLAQAGVDFLKKLTDGTIYISVREGSPLANLNNAEIVTVHGTHPAGNPSIQACNLKPVNKGDVVWMLNTFTLVKIGQLISTGKFTMDSVVAVTGCLIEKPYYAKCVYGTPISDLLKNEHLPEKHHRIISGNVLTGHPVSLDGYLRLPYYQITVIGEGDDYDEFMGWASLSPQKMSINRSFPGHFFKKKEFCPDARILGGRRAMIMSGLYDKVLPMDILPEYLIKAILSRNIERMESLGIYEVTPDDFALCEYVDPSKLELQKIVREGLDYLRNELS